jgi:hypothetical protein
VAQQEVAGYQRWAHLAHLIGVFFLN